jgi:uncharacterized membrane protein YdjX (TVP38/TMEM64 family)
MFSKRAEKIGSIFGIIVAVILIYFVAKNFHAVETTIQKAGYFGPIVTILIYGILAPTPITTDPLTVIGGVLFGPLGGIFVAFMGNNLAALVEYYVGKKVGQITKFDKDKNFLPSFLRNLKVESPVFLIFGRMIPGYGAKVISLIAGAYNVPLGVYIWTSMVVNLIGSILLTYGGYNLIHFLKL